MKFKYSMLPLIIAASLSMRVYGQKKPVDFFHPMELQSPLVSDGIWGAPNVLPRDTANGLESKTGVTPDIGQIKLEGKCYWDGRIVKDDEGNYHLYVSCWDQG